MIRPPDPAIVGTTLRYVPIESAEAMQRLVHLAFRDAHTALDLTYAYGRFWRGPLPPGLTVTSNNVDPASSAELHFDFTRTGLPDGAYDLAIYDPPHVTDPDGRQFTFCSGCCLLSSAVHGALPADLEAQPAQASSEAA